MPEVTALISFLRKHLPGVEKLLNRLRNWDWAFGGWGTGKFATWILAGLGALWAYVYAKAEGQPVSIVVTVTVGLFAAVVLAAYLLVRLWAQFRASASPTNAPAASAAPAGPPLVMEFGTGPEFDYIDPHAGEATRRIVCFALRNTTDRPMSDVAVRFRSIVPKPSASVYSPGALLKEEIAIPANDRRVVKLAYYDELYPSGYVSQKIGLFTPSSPAISGPFGSLVIDEKTRSHEVVLEASGPGISPVMERIILSVNHQPRFRLTRPS